MKLKKIKFTNFRNLNDIEIELSDGITVLKGKNAQGKTNFLESIYVLALTKSFRAQRSLDLIKWDQTYFKISGETVDDKDETHLTEAYFELTPQKRTQFKYNHNTLPARDYIGNLKTVTFIPDDLKIITGSPRHRRRYLDILLSQIDRGYLYVLSDYQKILKERNALLAQINMEKSNKDELGFWNDKLVDLGCKLMARRQMAIDFFNNSVEKLAKTITNDDISLKIKYLPSIRHNQGGSGDAGNGSNAAGADNKAMKQSFEEHLMAGIDGDILRKNTRKGPHRDDFEVLQNKRQLAIYGSRGEIRTALLTLKLCELDLFKQECDAMPVLLLDDVFSELDMARQKALFDMLEKYQVIITTTDQPLENIKNATIYNVDEGILTQS
ncbi:DNA replication/repair protein RecF [Patescibacteria group bacterium]|nr:DNA replication/repair protein RecF [Patescibacteria group bacterium]